MHSKKFKWLIISLVLVGYLVLDSIIFNVSLVNRAVSVGLAIDMDGKYINLTAQVVLPKNGGVSSGGNNYINYTAKGVDIYDAIDKIGVMSGTELSIAHTIVIVLGREVIENDKFDILEQLLSDNKINDNVDILMAEGKAQDIMTARVPTSEVASYQLYRLMNPVKHPVGMPHITLKEFVQNLHKENMPNYLPIVTKKPVPPSSDQESGGESEADMLIIDRAAVMDKTGYKGELSIDETIGLSFLTEDLKDGTIEITDSNGDSVSVQIVESKSKLKFDIKNEKLVIDIDMKTVRKTGRVGEGGILYYNMSESEIVQFKKVVSGYIDKCIDFSVQNKVDILDIALGFYKRNPKSKDYYYSEAFTKNLTIEYNISIIEK